MEGRGKVVSEDGDVKEERDVTDVHPEGDIGVVPLNVFVVWEFGHLLGVGGIQNVEDVHDGSIPSASCGGLVWRMIGGGIGERRRRKKERKGE